jgi:hypothetical protein
MIKVTKFNPVVPDPAPDILQGRTPTAFLKSKYIHGCIFGLDNLQKQGAYLLAGWRFDFRLFLKRFLVKQHGNWSEYYAPNKTTLRKSLYGRIDEIVAIP